MNSSASWSDPVLAGRFSAPQSSGADPIIGVDCGHGGHGPCGCSSTQEPIAARSCSAGAIECDADCSCRSGAESPDVGWTEAFGIVQTPTGQPKLSNGTKWGPDAGQSKDAEWQHPAPDGPLADGSFSHIPMGCITLGPMIQLPPWSGLPLGVNGVLGSETRLCFLLEYGAITDWPKTGCCPPHLIPKSCSVPAVPFYGLLKPYDPALWPAVFGAPPPAPTLTDVTEVAAVYEAAVKILRDNLDLVEWVLCLVASYSPDVAATGVDLVGTVMDLVTGVAPSFLMVVGSSGNPGAYVYNYPAEALASGEVGVILPAGDPNPASSGFWWQNLRDKVLRGSPTDAFCGAADAAIEILHEMVHIALDFGPWPTPGSNHANSVYLCQRGVFPPCWDEARMVDSALQWALSQRFPCLIASCSSCFVQAAPGFSLNDPWSALYSGCHFPWVVGC